MQVLLLMATALNVSVPEPYLIGPGDVLTKELRARQQSIAEITEMIHVSYASFKSLVQFFDDADIYLGFQSTRNEYGQIFPVILYFIPCPCFSKTENIL